MTTMTPLAASPDALRAYLETTDSELLVYIDPEHMSYRSLYLGRADARHALGQEPDAVLRELWLASRVDAAHAGVSLTRLPQHQLRRRRLQPLELALISGDRAILRRLHEAVGIDPLVALAGLVSNEVQAEIDALTGFFHANIVVDLGDFAGALGLLYTFMLSALADEDAAGFEEARRRAIRLIDDAGHLWGGIAQGGIARLKAVCDVIIGLKPANPEGIAQAILRHLALTAIEFNKAQAEDPEARDHAKGALDVTALALLAIAKAFDINVYLALDAAGAGPRVLAYARALGHSSPS